MCCACGGGNQTGGDAAGDDATGTGEGGAPADEGTGGGDNFNEDTCEDKCQCNWEGED